LKKKYYADEVTRILQNLNIGAALKAKKDYDCALKMYKRELSICKKTVGKGHASIASAQRNVGLIMQEKGATAR